MICMTPSWPLLDHSDPCLTNLIPLPAQCLSNLSVQPLPNHPITFWPPPDLWSLRKLTHFKTMIFGVISVDFFNHFCYFTYILYPLVLIPVKLLILMCLRAITDGLPEVTNWVLVLLFVFKFSVVKDIWFNSFNHLPSVQKNWILFDWVWPLSSSSD
jgi:hypothetical protein